LSQEIGDMEQLKQNYYSFYEYFMDNKDYKNAVDYLKTFMSIKDSLINESTTGQLNELQTKYESDKKEKEIELLNKDKEIQQTQIKQQKIINYGIVAGLLIVLVFSLLLFNRLKITRQQKNLIELQKQEVETKNEIIEEKQKEILDSIHYAKRIQTTLLTQKDFINNNLNDNFILFKPKDIVSGDFYWATKREHLFYLAVCDSTGHGVPGAFMSLLSINFLNEAINERKIESPDHIFNFVREKLIDNLSKDGQQDGFDGILLCFNQKTKQITYAAAHNAPIIIRNNEILTLEADKMPVGKGVSEAPFKLFELDHKPGDSLYLYTDGYADQFGGPRGKKYMYKQLNQFIISISNLEMQKQFEKLDYNFNNWRGNLEQVDDVCIIGIKL
jgi:serine phosphatase RsbU (regulator of sigma subunit)